MLHIVFDLDDTLYPERDYAIGGFRAASAWAGRALGLPDLTNDLIRLLDDGHLGRSFQMALAAAKPDHGPEDLQGLIRAYRAHTPTLRLFDDAASLLDQLRDRPLGLITDGHDKTQRKKVSALGIAPRFGSIVYTGGLGADRAFHKPHPRAFELTEAALGAAGSRFVYIGDNPAKDFLAPNARGWVSVLVDRPAHRHHRIHPLSPAPAGGRPHHTVETLAALPDVLGL
jgi:putative hydrolase of the HAD superfamily